MIYLHFIVLSCLSFLQISGVFLKPNKSHFRNINSRTSTEFSKIYFAFALCHLTAEVSVILTILIISMLLKEVKIENFTHKFQVYKIKNTICGWHAAAAEQQSSVQWYMTGVEQRYPIQFIKLKR